MKNCITLIFLVVFSLSAVSQEELLEGPFLQIESDTIYYGFIQEKDSAFKMLKITNTGNQPLLISSCKASCGCTIPICPSIPILPGMSNFIKLQYDATEKSGKFLKTVTIKSNAINHIVYIKVKGEVIQ